jgi:SAM-dependent methyltransferase
MSEQLPLRRCPICEAPGRKTLFTQRFESLGRISLIDGYEVVACKQCGFVFAGRIPASDAFERYYAQASKYEYSHRNGEQHAAERTRLELLAGRIAKLAPPSSRLLDVGCSTGELLVALRAYGFLDLTGLDPSETCVAYARDNHGFLTIHQAFGNKPAKIDPFDVIVLSAVLEHVPDLHPFVDYLDQWLTPHGLLVVEVPDAEMFSMAFNAPYQEFSVEHINFFSTPALDNLLGPHGYARVATYQGLLSAGGKLTSPVLTAMYRSSTPSKKPIRESITEAGVVAYVEKCVAKADAEREVIAKLVQSQESIVVWGVGTLCQRLLATTELPYANIFAFVDSNPHYHGSRLIGKPVLPPTALAASRNDPILVASWGFFEEIHLQIRNDLGLTNDIIRIDQALTRA